MVYLFFLHKQREVLLLDRLAQLHKGVREPEELLHTHLDWRLALGQLVDEIDLHLHPKWQREIIGFLTQRFPNTQFIATAHSPLVVQAAEDANVVLLKRTGDHVLIENFEDGLLVSAERSVRLLSGCTLFF